MVQVHSASPFTPEAEALINASNSLMHSLYPAESNHLDGAETLAQEHVCFAVATHEGKTLGCGAVKRLDGYGEIKRLFVHPEARGLGVARAVMQFLESHLLSHGVSIARLEVGIHQPEALALYKNLGYRERAPFGDYQLDPLSLFFEKDLSGITACK